MPVYQLEDAIPDLPPQGEYWMAETAVVIGRVRLGRDVGLWDGAVLRGDNEWIDVGAGSNIQEASLLHTDMGFPLTIGRNCTIGHHAILHGCTLGDGSLIGMGACVLNGARIGSNCLVGAGALVTENKEFPDGALIVGSPAKVVRMLDADAIARLQASAHNYVANWKRYQTGLRRISS